MIVSAGEALIDLLPTRDGDGRPALRPAIGGSPFNVALALGRLGAPAGFMGAISTDAFGDQLVAALAEAGVSTELVARVARPSPLAIVSLDGAEPGYSFYDTGTAARGLVFRELKPLPPHVSVLHLGSIALAADPAASTLIARAAAARAERIISVDPNVRPAFAPNEAVYRRNLDAALGLADIVKLSLADLAWLRPSVAPSAFAAERLAAGAALVVVTRGPLGATAYRGGDVVDVPAPSVQVVDTVGAGDAFMAGLLAALAAGGLVLRADLAGLDRPVLAAVLGFAAEVAAVTCTRAGADPPRRADLAGFHSGGR